MPRAMVVVLVLLALVALALVAASFAGRDSATYRAVSTLAGPLGRAMQAPPAPGAEWAWRYTERAAVSREGEAFVVRATGETLWFHNTRGPIALRVVEGDVTIRARVSVRKQSDPGKPPDSQWQFAGLMLRDPAGDAWMSREDWVFNVLGFCCGELQIETKSTRAGRSDIRSQRWEGGDAELAIERRGARLTLRARRPGTEPWTEVAAYDRPDLPSRLQVGVVAYATAFGNGPVDLLARIEDVRVD